MRNKITTDEEFYDELFKKLPIMIILLFILTVFVCYISFGSTGGLKTGYKGGMHSSNDGCGHVVGDFNKERKQNDKNK